MKSRLILSLAALIVPPVVVLLVVGSTLPGGVNSAAGMLANDAWSPGYHLVELFGLCAIPFLVLAWETRRVLRGPRVPGFPERMTRWQVGGMVTVAVALGRWAGGIVGRVAG